MTRSDLQSATRKKLAQMARRHRISGWHSMRKEELIDALARRSPRNGRPPDRPARAAISERCRLKPTRRCDRRGPMRDQLVVEEVDERWLRARWVLSEHILDRARAALGEEWQRAVPVLRVFDVTERNGAAAEREFVKDEEIRLSIDDWYIPVEHSALSFRVELGYRTPQGAFFVLARSAKVRTPRLGGMRGPRPNGGRANGSSSSAGDKRNGTLQAATRKADRSPHAARSPAIESVFEIDAEIVLYGQAHPRSDLTLMGKPVQPHADGTFAVRMSLADGRQVIPAVCVSPNRCMQRTIVLAIERNTKRLEPAPLDDLG
jgi:uncharacterized protein